MPSMSWAILYHEDQFPPSGMSVRCRLGQATFAGTDRKCVLGDAKAPGLGDREPLERTGNRSATGGWCDLLRCAGTGSNDYVYMIIPPDNPEIACRCQACTAEG